MNLIVHSLPLLILFISSSCLPPNTFLDAVEQVAYYGYPLEIHNVTTEDGYILQLHRIPHGLNNTKTDNKTAVLFMPALICSSGVYFVYGSEKSLAFILANQDYDVWVANYRGTTYSRKHVTLDPDTEPAQFFDYSWHEIGVYDIPASIDYILNITGQKDLLYVGHSMGTTSYFAMAARAEYFDKVRLSVLLGPIAYNSHIPQPFAQIGSYLKDVFQLVTTSLGIYELLPKSQLITDIAPFCADESLFQPICTGAIGLLMGWDFERLNSSVLPLFFSVAPAGATVKIIEHYNQNVVAGTFKQYDYGVLGNIAKYGQLTPPNYDLESVTSPVALYYASNDYFVSIIDVNRLAGELPNLARQYLVPNDKFNHLDFLYAKQINELLHDDILDLLKKY